MKIILKKNPHNVVASVRWAVEFFLFLIFVFWTSQIPWLQSLPNLNYYRISVIIAVFFSTIYLALTIYRDSKNQGLGKIPLAESITDGALTAFLIVILGGMNGPLFFMYFLMIMEAAFTLSVPAILTVALIGVVVVLGEFAFLFFRGEFLITPFNLFLIFFRIVSIGLISFYGQAFAQSIFKERETTKKLTDAYEELRKLDRAKSEFMSIASHQLRTPLTAIKGYISMMLEKSYGKPPETMEKPLANIYASNERLIKLVNDLLNVSRIESGKMEMKLEKLSLEEIISSIIEELKNVVKEKNIYLKFEKPEKPLPKVLVDKDKIRQVILNIIDNAIRYTNKGGITIKLKIENLKLKIIISDTGEGMTKEEMAHLFESFSRGTAGTRFWTEGAGLGLYVVKRFIEMHKGRIWAESRGKNKGSTFYIELSIT